MAQPLGTVLFGIKKVPSVLDKDVVVLGQGPIGQGLFQKLESKGIIGPQVPGSQFREVMNSPLVSPREDEL